MGFAQIRLGENPMKTTYGSALELAGRAGDVTGLSAGPRATALNEYTPIAAKEVDDNDGQGS